MKVDLEQDPILEIERFIAAQREAKGKLRSWRQVSLAIGSQTTIQHWISGRSRATNESAEKLARLMQEASGWFGSAQARENFIKDLVRRPRIPARIKR